MIYGHLLNPGVCQETSKELATLLLLQTRTLLWLKKVDQEFKASLGYISEFEASLGYSKWVQHGIERRWDLELWFLSVVLWPWTLAISENYLTPFRFNFLSQLIETLVLLALHTQGSSCPFGQTLLRFFFVMILFKILPQGKFFLAQCPELVGNSRHKYIWKYEMERVSQWKGCSQTVWVGYTQLSGGPWKDLSSLSNQIWVLISAPCLRIAQMT